MQQTCRSACLIPIRGSNSSQMLAVSLLPGLRYLGCRSRMRQKARFFFPELSLLLPKKPFHLVATCAANLVQSIWMPRTEGKALWGRMSAECRRLDASSCSLLGRAGGSLAPAERALRAGQPRARRESDALGSYPSFCPALGMAPTPVMNLGSQGQPKPG